MDGSGADGGGAGGRADAPPGQAAGGAPQEAAPQAQTPEAQPEPRSKTAARLRVSSGPRVTHQVLLHVYDLDVVVSHLNEALLLVNLGAFHCGVEALGDEWSYAWGESQNSGVRWTEPQRHQVHVYRESVLMGASALSEPEIRTTIAAAMCQWPENAYHPIHKNCVHFAEDLLSLLRVPEPLPPWIRGAADSAGASPFLAPVIDWGWEWTKWCCSSAPLQAPTAKAAEAAEVAGDEALAPAPLTVLGRRPSRTPCPW